MNPPSPTINSAVKVPAVGDVARVSTPGVHRHDPRAGISCPIFVFSVRSRCELAAPADSNARVPACRAAGIICMTTPPGVRPRPRRSGAPRRSRSGRAAPPVASPFGHHPPASRGQGQRDPGSPPAAQLGGLPETQPEGHQISEDGNEVGGEAPRKVQCCATGDMDDMGARARPHHRWHTQSTGGLVY